MNSIVKRIISGLLSTAMLALCATSLTACKTDDTPQTTNTSFNYETDMQYMYYAGGVFAPITKSDTGYYYVGGHDMVIYVDKESQKATPLCSKPNCLHTSDEDCDAYFFQLATRVDLSLGTFSVPIQYYKGNLYMVIMDWTADGVSYCYLLKTDKAGKNREKVTNDLDFATMNWMIHRGYFYYTTDCAVKRIPLDNPKSEPEEVFALDKNKTYEGNLDAFSNLIAYGDYVYFEATEMDMENNSSIESCFMYSVNTSSLKSTRLEERGKDLSLETFFDDSLITYTYNTKTDKKPVYYKSNLDGSNRQVITGENFDKVHNYSDGKYFYQDNQYEAYKKNLDHVITVYDKDSNKVDSFKLKEGKGIQDFYAQDEDYFISIAKDENGERQLVMADKSQIGNINGGVIEWKSLCKYMWFVVDNSPYIVVKENDDTKEASLEAETKADVATAS